MKNMLISKGLSKSNDQKTEERTIKLRDLEKILMEYGFDYSSNVEGEEEINNL